MKIKFPHLKTMYQPRVPANHVTGVWQGMLLLLLVTLQTGFSSFTIADGGKPISTESSTTEPAVPTAEWVLSNTVQNVDFYYQITSCNGKQVVLLKFNNRNTSKVKVSWKEVFTTQFENGKEGSGKKSLLISTGETFETDCSNAKIRECVVLPSQVNPAYNADIRKFNFKDITVVNQ